MKEKLRTIWSRRWWLKVGTDFFTIAGMVALCVELANISVSAGVHVNWISLLVGLLLLFLVSVKKNWPKKSICKTFTFPDTQIFVKHGNLLDEKGGIVIGFSDTFDTEVGSVINYQSLQGQFQRFVYGSNQQRLDKDIEDALKGVPTTIDPNKVNGKKLRYPIGTIAVLNQANKNYYCCAYAFMDKDCHAHANIDDIWHSLTKLWDIVRSTGELEQINIPVIGSGLARVPGASHNLMIKLLILSFLANSRISKVSKELTIVMSEENKEKITLLDIQDFLDSLD